MDRREYVKLMLAGSVGAGLFLQSGCTPEDRRQSEQILEATGAKRGYTAEELERDQKLQEKTFFNPHERATVEQLSDWIIPEDERSPGALEAGVPDFIDFMMLDLPDMQVPMRGGLMWLDSRSRDLFGESFVDCDRDQQQQMLDRIAWPDRVEPEWEFGMRFFNRMRDLVATGFFTSEIGLQDLDYRGNQPNVWDGVPDEVLEKHGLAYDEKTLNETVRPDERGLRAEWTDNGELIRPDRDA